MKFRLSYFLARCGGYSIALLFLFTASVVSSGCEKPAIPGKTEPDSRIKKEARSQSDFTEVELLVLHIEQHGWLPDTYLTKREARKRGWRPGRDLWEVAKGYRIGGDRFYNRERLLPERPGLKYYEADLNYYGGRRGACRLVYSKQSDYYHTCDHYKSFTEIHEETLK